MFRQGYSGIGLVKYQNLKWVVALDFHYFFGEYYLLSSI